MALDFNTWLTGGTYESNVEFGTDIFAVLNTKTILTRWEVKNISTNTYAWNIGKAIKPATSIQINTPLTLTKSEGQKETIALDQALVTSIIFSKNDIEATGAPFIQFQLRQEMELLLQMFEDSVFDSFITKGTPSLNTTEITQVSCAKVILDIRKQLLKAGSNLNNIDLFATPDVCAMLMLDPSFVNYQKTDSVLRTGVIGKIGSMEVIEAPRLGETDAQSKVDIVAVDMTQGFSVRKTVTPLSYVDAPSNYMESMIMKSLDYYNHVIANPTNFVYHKSTNI